MCRQRRRHFRTWPCASAAPPESCSFWASSRRPPAAAGMALCSAWRTQCVYRLLRAGLAQYGNQCAALWSLFKGDVPLRQRRRSTAPCIPSVCRRPQAHYVLMVTTDVSDNLRLQPGFHQSSAFSGLYAAAAGTACAMSDMPCAYADCSERQDRMIRGLASGQ